MWSHTVTNPSSAAQTFQTKRLNAERHRCKNNIQHHPLWTGVTPPVNRSYEKKTEPTSIFCAAKAWSISFLHNWSNTHCHTVGLPYILTDPSGQWLKTVHVSSCFVALSASKTIKKNEKRPEHIPYSVWWIRWSTEMRFNTRCLNLSTELLHLCLQQSSECFWKSIFR